MAAPSRRPNRVGSAHGVCPSQRCEERGASVPVEASGVVGDDVSQALHDEIERLPERFRLPLVLCDLEECSQQRAARHLGWPIGTVKSRLARGRERLRDRLTRRGLAPEAGVMVAAAGHDASSAVRLPVLIDSAARAAVQFASGRTIAAGSTFALTNAVLRSIISARWLKAVMIVVAGAAGTAGGLLAGHGASGQDPSRLSNPANAAAAGEKQVGDLPDGTIVRIEFEGTSVAAQTIMTKMSSRVGQSISRERLDADMTSLLRTKWFSRETIRSRRRRLRAGSTR